MITHLCRGGIGSRFGYSNFHFESGHFLFSFKFLCVSTRGIICWYTINCSYPLFLAFIGSIVIGSVVVGSIVIGLVVVRYGSIVVGFVVFGLLSLDLNPLPLDLLDIGPLSLVLLSLGQLSLDLLL